jgi:hypothetical protein
MTRFMLTAIALAVSGAALAKLPPPDEAAKAKAAEAAAKTAWQAKIDTYQLCKVQDRIAANYKSRGPAKAAASAAAPGAAPAAAPGAPAATAMPTAAPAAAAAAKPAASATTAAASAGKAPTPVPSSASASQGGSTPVAAVMSNNPPIPPCADPGPFAYAPPEQKPLESSGAHSPAANASSPPSVRAESGTMTDGKTGAATKK